MVLIADSGSTKCTWIASDGARTTNVRTQGINAVQHSAEQIREALAELPPCDGVTSVRFYGAGCGETFPEASEKLRRELDELLCRPPVDEIQAKSLAFRLSSLQLDAIGPEKYETLRLRRMFQGRVPMAELEQELLHESVRRITVSNGTVTVLLKNNQTLEGGNYT